MPSIRDARPSVAVKAIRVPPLPGSRASSGADSTAVAPGQQPCAVGWQSLCDAEGANEPPSSESIDIEAEAGVEAEIEVEAVASRASPV